MKKIPVLLVVVALTMISCSTCSDSGFKFSYTSSDEMEVSTRDIRGFEKIEVGGLNPRYPWLREDRGYWLAYGVLYSGRYVLCTSQRPKGSCCQYHYRGEW